MLEARSGESYAPAVYECQSWSTDSGAAGGRRARRGEAPMPRASATGLPPGVVRSITTRTRPAADSRWCVLRGKPDSERSSARGRRVTPGRANVSTLKRPCGPPASDSYGRPCLGVAGRLELGRDLASARTFLHGYGRHLHVRHRRYALNQCAVNALLSGYSKRIRCKQIGCDTAPCSLAPIGTAVKGKYFVIASVVGFSRFRQSATAVMAALHCGCYKRAYWRTDNDGDSRRRFAEQFNTSTTGERC